MSNGDKPYYPDRVGNVLPPDEVRRRAGFDQQMDAVFGTALDIPLTDEQKKALSNEEQQVFLNITTENSLEGTTGSISLTDPLEATLVSAYRWDGLSLTVPPLFSAVVATVQDLLDSIIALMNIVRVILETILKFLTDLGDLVKKIIEKVLEKVSEVLGLLGGKTALHFIQIPPIFPALAASKERLKLIEELDSFVLGEPLPVTTGGNDGFITVLQNSLDDSLDLNRPQFGSTAWVGGIIAMYGGTDLSGILDIIKALTLLFKNLFAASKAMQPPAPIGFSATVLGAERVLLKKTPNVKLKWDKQLLKIQAYPKWYAFKENLYYIPHPAFLTDEEKKDTELQEALRNFAGGSNPGGKALEKREVYSRELQGIAAFGKVYLDREWDKTDIGRTFIYRVSRSYYRETAPGVFEQSNGANAVTEVFSTPATITLGTSAKTIGEPPNWWKGSILDLFPDLGDLVEQLEVFLEDILAGFGDLLEQYKEFINQILAELNKWILFAAKLSTILSALKAVLSPKAGVHSLLFFGKGGNDYMMQVLRDSIANAPEDPYGIVLSEEELEDAEKAAKAAADAETLAEKAAVHWKGVGDAFAELYVTEWNYADAGSRVPSFGPNDVTGGFVLMGGDESIEAVRALIELISLLFGDVTEDKSANVKALEATGPDMVRLTPTFTETMLVGDPPIETVTQTIFDAEMLPVSDQAEKAEVCP